ncbi:MAG TPA: ATP synthase F1 subunit delta [Chthonomonadales bacterium]|nr:ATP synthase F1 subunit delta [Chthonomonadales bacterium]
MPAGDTRAARRYAAALFNTAARQEKLDAVERDIHTVLDLMERTAKLRQFWESPLAPAGRKRELIGRIFEGSIDGLTLSFLRLLVDKRREHILDQVDAEMRRLGDEARRLIRASATFAVAPSAQEQEDLVRSLESRTGERISLVTEIDPAIIGGVVVRMQDTILDGSVRGALERIREQLLHES